MTCTVQPRHESCTIRNTKPTKWAKPKPGMANLDPELKPGSKFRIWCCNKVTESRLCTMIGITPMGLVRYYYDENVRCVPAEDSEWPSHCMHERFYSNRPDYRTD